VKVQLDASQDLSGYVTTDQLGGYATTEQLTGYATTDQLTGYATQEALNNEINARAGMISNFGGTVHFGGGAPIIINGSALDVICASPVNLGATLVLTQGSLDVPNGSGLRIANTDGTIYYALRVDEDNNVQVGNRVNNLYLRGPTVYLYNSNVVVTSDRRAKHSIEELPDAYVEALDKLTPMRFKYNDGTSDRYHVGFIAQDVEAALAESGLTTKDFGGFVDLNGDGEALGLAYDEFIGLLFQKIRKLEKKIEAMEEKQ
jgi:hypothetical protein